VVEDIAAEAAKQRYARFKRTSSLGSDPEAVSDLQHPDQQFRCDPIVP
jgi:hypothetical protein